MRANSEPGTSSNAREIARRLLAHEREIDRASTDARVECRVCEKLGRPLSALAGGPGFRSILARAVTLAKRESSTLASVRVQDDGTLEGLPYDKAESSGLLTAHLLELLMTFIGEALTMRFISEVWPDLPDSEGKPQRNEPI